MRLRTTGWIRSSSSRASVSDFTKARDELRYEPELTWRDIESERRVKFAGQ